MTESKLSEVMEDKVTCEIKRVSCQVMLVEMYKWKRLYCALNEWLSYFMLLLLFALHWYGTIIIILPLVAFAIATSYRNLDELEEEMGYI